MQAGQGKVQVSGNLGGLRRSLSGRPLNNGVRSESGSSVPGWQGGGGADSGAIGGDDNAARRDAGTREPGGHYSGVSLAPAAGSRPSRRAAFCLRIFGLTSSLTGRAAKSASQRSGVSSGKSEPNRTLSCSSVLAYCTSCGGKYFGDQPDRSMYTPGLWVAMLSASSCQGKDGCARMIFRPGKSAATSSMYSGLEYFSRIPPPPGTPAPMPVCPVWNSAIPPRSSIASYR